MCKEFKQPEHKNMSGATVETADFVRRMVKAESNGWGDEAEALRRVARSCKLSFWTLNNLRIGRAKSVSAEIRDRVRAAFIDHCRRSGARCPMPSMRTARKSRSLSRSRSSAAIRLLTTQVSRFEGGSNGERRT
jgi:hypothetical protein